MFRPRIPALFPALCVFLFVVLYIIAAVLYPGGSLTDAHTHYFSIIHNYWCDLLGPVAINKEVNPGMPFAVAALFVLSAGLIVLWYLIATTFSDGRLRRWVLMTGIFSFTTATMLFTSFHDYVIHISGTFATASFALVFIGLYKQKKYPLIISGLVCMAFGALNYYIWQTKHMVSILPLLQKITFLLMLVWFVLLNISVTYSGNNYQPGGKRQHKEDIPEST